MSIWIQNLYDSNFLGFHGSWVERDFNQLVTAAFQGICEANSGRECVGLVTATSSGFCPAEMCCVTRVN